MSDAPDEIGPRLRAVAEEGRRDPLSLSGASVAAQGRRSAGGPVARRHRLSLWGSSVLDSIAALGQRPGQSARRVAALGFVAALIAVAAIGLVGSRSSGHSHLSASRTTLSGSTQPLGGNTGPSGSTTSTTVGGATTTSQPNVVPTTSSLPTTTIVPTSQPIAGYQEVQQSNTTSCTTQPSADQCSPTGALDGSATVDCPTGTKVLGGGGSAAQGSSGAAGSASVIASYPTSNGAGWTVIGSSTQAPITVTAYATCADVAS